MSRIGKKPIIIPASVTVTLEGNKAIVKGPKGELVREFNPDIKINIEESEINVSRPSDNKNHRALHGTTRSVLNNMIIGVEKGYQKTLELVGVGYRAQKQGNKVTLNVGYSNPVEMEEPKGIKIEVPENTKVIVSGHNKEQVGEVAANIRAIRPPEPYKGKGIRYEGEYVRRKEGKTGK